MSSAERAVRTERERNWRYDVFVLNADDQMKLACVKILRELLPEFGLKQQIEFVQSAMPVAVANVECRVARRVRDRLLNINAEASMQSTVSTSLKQKDKIAVPEPNPVAIGFIRQHALGCEVLLRTFKDHTGCNCDCH